MSDLKQELEDFGFTRKGIITVKVTDDRKYPLFELDNPLENFKGNVYLWVIEENDIPAKILYIGKAGDTIAKRCSQHEGGFKGGSKTGLRNATKLLLHFSNDTKVSIYARHSERMKVLGQDDISLCEAEEKALIRFYKSTYELFNNI